MLRRLINLINQLRPTNPPLLQLPQPLKHPLQPTFPNFRRVHTNLLTTHQLRRQLPKLLREFEILLLGRILSGSKRKGLASNSISQCVLVLDVIPVVLGWQEVGDGTAFGGDGFGADGGGLAFGDAVEDVGQLVFGVFADLLGDVWVFVVEGC